MIKTFCCKETQKIFNYEYSKKLPTSIQKKALMKLLILDASISLNDLRTPPSNHLEPLKGKFKNKHSIRINDQWRIIFEWSNGHAYQVQIIDYH